MMRSILKYIKKLCKVRKDLNKEYLLKMAQRNKDIQDGKIVPKIVIEGDAYASHISLKDDINALNDLRETKDTKAYSDHIEQEVHRNRILWAGKHDEE